MRLTSNLIVIIGMLLVICPSAYAYEECHMGDGTSATAPSCSCPAGTNKKKVDLKGGGYPNGAAGCRPFVPESKSSCVWLYYCERASDSDNNMRRRQAPDDPRACQMVMKTKAEIEALLGKEPEESCATSEKIKKISKSIRGANCASKMGEIDRVLKRHNAMACWDEYYRRRGYPSEIGVRG